MVSAAELIEALQRRMRLVAPHLRRAPGEFPPGWQRWFASMGERRGAVTGASAAAFVAVLQQRPLAMPPRRLDELTSWQAFSTLWRQQWHPPAREDRPWRWFAGAVTVLWHLFFGTLLLWLMYLQYYALPSREGESVVQVELLGTGTPDEAGGGAGPEQAEPVEPAQVPPPSTPARPASSRPERASVPPPTAAEPVLDLPVLDTPVLDAPALDAPAPEVTLREVPEPQAPAQPAPAEQAVTVSEPVPDRSDDFVLPPTTPRIAAPTVTAPELSAPAPSVQVIDIPAPLSPRGAAMPQVEVEVPRPALSQRAPEVAVREVPAPLQRAPVAAVPEPSLPAPELRSAVPQVREATIPMPAPPAPTTAATPSESDAPRPAAPGAAATPARAAALPSGEERPASAAPGAGPRDIAAPGSWPTPARADDWGEATRERPGAQRGEDGLYDRDGSVRLADGPGSASPGNAPGTVTEEIADLDRAGTWLKRPPHDYEPTAFDRFWRPNETLLEEWVRRSIKTMRIPIPGTNKYIVCQTVLLALGGGCAISDPNLNEQPAAARPPPDIPFKPELQEDNGSVRPPPVD